MKIKAAPEITDSSLSLSRETDRSRKDGEKDNEGAEGWKYAEQLLQAALAWYQAANSWTYFPQTHTWPSLYIIKQSNGSRSRLVMCCSGLIKCVDMFLNSNYVQFEYCSSSDSLRK